MFDHAMLVATAMRDLNFKPRTKGVAAAQVDFTSPFLEPTFEKTEDFRVYNVASQCSHSFALEGKPLLAAAALLAVGDVNSAASLLLHCGELIWALAVNQCSPNPSEKFWDVFGRYTISLGVKDNFFANLPKDVARALTPLIHFDSTESRDLYYKSKDLKTAAEYFDDAKKARGFARLQFFAMAGSHAEAIVFGLQNIKAIMSEPVFNFSEAIKYLDAVSDVHCSDDKLARELVAVSFYFATFRAMWRGYWPIIKSLVDAAVALIKDNNIEWLSGRIAELKLATAVTLARGSIAAAKAYVATVGDAVQGAYKAIADLPADFTADGGSTVVPRGCGVIPTDITVPPRVSLCSGVSIIGDPFVLDDDEQAMSKQEALMWFEVTPFSPLPTHKRFVPF
jgi:hypothetical protein